MSLISKLRAGATFRPSLELVRSCETALMAKAHCETLRPIVEGYQRRILESGDFRMSGEMRATREKAGVDLGPERITEPELSYRLGDDDAQRYYEACNKARKEAGLFISKPGNCPLLEAGHLHIQAEHALLEVFAKEMGDPTLAAPILMEHRKKLLEIIYRLVTPHIGSAEQIMRRLVA